jgi:4-amino-4-deoxy-L-arabinose transferase-like glycosyltransferase
MLMRIQQPTRGEHIERKIAVQILLLIYLIAVLLRLAPVSYKEWKNPNWHNSNINEIEFYYDDVARSLLVGKGFVHSVNPRSSDLRFSFKPGTPFHFVPPLYAWWLYLIYLVFGPEMFPAKIIQCFLDASVCPLLFLLGKRIFVDRNTAILSAALYAMYPLAIVMCSTLYYQIPLNIALCLVLIGFISSVTKINGILTGIALGLSALAKPITLPFLLILPGLRIAESIFERVSLKPAIGWSLAFVLSALITLTPWTIRNYMVFNRFVPVQNGGNEVFVQGSKEEYIDLDVDKLRQRYPKGLAPSGRLTITAIENHLAHLRERPADYVRFLAKKFLLTWYNTEGKDKNLLALLAQIPFLLFSIISLVFSSRLWVRRPGIYLIGTILYVCGLQVILFPLVRYTLAIMPLVMLITAEGMMTFAKKARLY